MYDRVQDGLQSHGKMRVNVETGQPTYELRAYALFEKWTAGAPTPIREQQVI